MLYLNTPNPFLVMLDKLIYVIGKLSKIAIKKIMQKCFHAKTLTFLQKLFDKIMDFLTAISNISVNFLTASLLVT